MNRPIKSVFAVALPVTIFVGLLAGSGPLYNVAIGFGWVVACVGLFSPAAMIDNEEVKKLRVELSERPEWRKVWSPSADLSIAVVLAMTAHWFLFGFWCWQAIWCFLAERQGEREAKEKARDAIAQGKHWPPIPDGVETPPTPEPPEGR